MPNANDQSELILYQTDDGITRIHVRLVDGSVWLTQRQLAELYQVTVPAISQHINHIFEDGELAPEATVKSYLTVRTEGNRKISRTVDHYSLPVVLAVGYRVRSLCGTPRGPSATSTTSPPQRSSWRVNVINQNQSRAARGREMRDALLRDDGGGRQVTMRQDRAGDGRGALVIGREHGRRERCSKACYSDCPTTSARVHRARRHRREHSGDRFWSFDSRRLHRSRSTLPPHCHEETWAFRRARHGDHGHT